MNKKKELLFSVTIKDCRVDTFTVGGHGGSGKDTSNTGVRITHPPSGAVGTSTETRSQLHNKQTAFRRMAESKEFQAWTKRVASGFDPAKLALVVDAWCEPENLKVEVRDVKGRWVTMENE